MTNNGQLLTMAEKWKQRLRDSGKPLVELQTTKGIWYICGIEHQDDAKMTVSYLAQSGKHGSHTVKRETVKKSDIVRVRHYVNI